MADTKISQLPAVVAVSGTDEFAVNQAFASKKVSTAQLQSFISTGSFTGSMVGSVVANLLTQSDATAGFHNEGYTEWHELVATPATPDVNHARIYAADFHGFSTLNMLDSQGLVIRVGQDATFTVRNNFAVTITKGSIVHITGAQAGAATVVLAIASASAVMPADGIAVTDIAPAAYGRVMIHGELSGINTAGFLEGDTLFVSAVNAGQFVSTAPMYPYISQQVATVLTATNNGTIRVGIQAFDRSVVAHSFAISGSLVVTNSGSFGGGVNVTSATSSFGGKLYIPANSGSPSSSVTTIGGTAPFKVDVVNNLLYAWYGNKWHSASLSV